MKLIKLLLMIFAIPLIGIFSSFAMQNKLDSDFKMEVLKAGDVSEEQLNNITLKKLCGTNEFRSEASGICSEVDNVDYIALSSWLAIALGVLLLVAIIISGKLAKLSRQLLLWLFRFGINITFFSIVCLILLSSAIILGLFYYLPVIYTEYYYPKLLILVCIGALYGLYVVFQALWGMRQKAETFVVGQLVTKNEQPRLWEYVDNLADKIGAQKPQNIVLGLEPNFYVTEANVNGLGFNLKGRTMYLSLSLSRILTEPQLRSVIGHELGHYIGLDTQFSKKFFPIYRGTSHALAGFQSVASGNNSAVTLLVLLPAMGILNFFFDAFSIAESKLSRDRELIADSVGAKISDNKALSIALIKIHAFTEIWNVIQKHNSSLLEKNGTYLTNQSTYFKNLISKIKSDVDFDSLANTQTSHPTDTHPTLAERLDSLSLKINDLKSEALETDFEKSGIDLFDNVEELEGRMSFIDSIILARKMGIDLDSTIENTSNPSS